MKNLLKSFLVVIAWVCTSAGLTAQNQFTVLIQGIDEPEGSVMVALFEDQDDFPKNPTVGKIVRVEGKSVQVTFKDLRAGAYALSVIHDRNSNGKLDTNAFGIPTEGIAFGNNASGIFGPPSFKRSRVRTDQTSAASHVVQLKYY